jgi:hypothetical protein
MVKYMGLGIACLTLVLSGVTRASVISLDNGQNGKCITDDKGKDKGCSDDKNFKLDDCKDIKLEIEKCKKDGCKDDKDLKDCKDDKDCKDGKKDKDHFCKIVWHDHHDKCDQRQDDCDYGKDCGLVIDPCYHHDHGCKDDGCSCASVPTPASSALGGAGLGGIMLMSFLRSRRSVIA